MPAELSAEKLRFIQEAANYLERPGFLTRVANLVGKPVEGMLQVLPRSAQALVADVTNAALVRAVEWAAHSLTHNGWPIRRATKFLTGPRFHTALTATTGAVGGLFGLPGAALEIPATTTLMLRSIAEIARRNGSDPSQPEVRLQCLAVFSFGAPNLEAMESAYFSSRMATALAVREAAQYVALHSAREIGTALSRGTAPVLVRLLNQIAARFQIVVTQKLAAQAVPLAGAAMGSLINAAFTDHFNRVAEYHFGIVRLEQDYGQEAVHAAYRAAVEAAKRQAS